MPSEGRGGRRARRPGGMASTAATAGRGGARSKARRRGRRLRRGAPNETATRILAAALDVFAERGFDGATTREIAAGAGVNLGLLQYYFGDKEALWKAAVDRVYAELGAEVRGAAAAHAGDADGGAAALLRALVRFAARRPAFVRLMNDEGKRSGPRMRWLADRHGTALYAAAVEVLGRVARREALRDVPPVHLYYMLIGAIGMIFSQAPECRRLTGIDPTASERAVEDHAEAVVRLFLV
jgi:TetR/AcrR family transcriptional regulator